MKTEQITATEYTVVQKRMVEDYYTVKASSKAEAVRMVEEHETYEYETYTEKEYKPKVTAVTHYDTCPNVGEGWSDISLSDLKEMRIGQGLKWHYNGRCVVTKVTTESHCYHCREAMRTGKRLLTNEEKVYLKKEYGECRNMNTEE